MRLFLPCAGFVLLALGLCNAARGATPLTLKQAVSLAVSRDAGSAALTAEARAARQRAVAAGQLPNPELQFGVMNLPTDTFSTADLPMTGLQIGISQKFPAGDSLDLAASKGEQMAHVVDAQAAARRLEVVRATRTAWLQLYYAAHALPLIRKSEEAVMQLAGIVRSQYATGHGSQKAIAQARLEANLLKARALDAQGALAAARAGLARWIGAGAAARPLPQAPGNLPPIPGYDALLHALPRHPLVAVQNAELAAKRTSVDIARQQYKPEWGVGLAYDVRHGPGMNGVGRQPDTVSAMVSLSLPLFTANRQDRKVGAAKDEVAAATYRRDDLLRKLKRQLDADWARYMQLKSLVALYDKKVTANAGMTFNAALAAYRNNALDFDELVRAELARLDAALGRLKAQREYETVWADLLYLDGDFLDRPHPNPLPGGEGAKKGGVKP